MWISKAKLFLFGGIASLPLSAEIGVTVLRLFAGLSMAFAHGINKVPPGEGFVDFTGSLGFPFPLLFAWKAGLAELLGGIFLAAGFLTRPVALALAFTMFVAAFMAHGSDPYGDKELPLLFMVAYLQYLLMGGGRWSMDALLRSRV